MLAPFRGYILGGFCFMLFAGASWAQIAAIEGDVKGTKAPRPTRKAITSTTAFPSLALTTSASWWMER